MRMWMVDPRLLCRQHLLGEHNEIHKHHHNFVKHHRMQGRRGQIFPKLMQVRHDELVAEMLRRGYNHQSPYDMPDISYLGEMAEDTPTPDQLMTNLADLAVRCPECLLRQTLYPDFTRLVSMEILLSVASDSQK